MPREVLYCELCGRPVPPERAKRITIEGVELTVCERCYAREIERARRAGLDVPARLRFTSAPQPRLEEPPRPQRKQAPPTPRAALREPGSTAKPKPARSSTSSLGAVEKFEIVEDYAERVRRARERLGWTQRMLAVKVKVSENVIRRIEAGTLKPTIDLARRLEKVLGVKLLEPVVEEESEAFTDKSGGRRFYLTLGDIAELRRD